MDCCFFHPTCILFWDLWIDLHVSVVYAFSLLNILSTHKSSKNSQSLLWKKIVEISGVILQLIEILLLLFTNILKVFCMILSLALKCWWIFWLILPFQNCFFSVKFFFSVIIFFFRIFIWFHSIIILVSFIYIFCLMCVLKNTFL